MPQLPLFPELEVSLQLYTNHDYHSLGNIIFGVELMGIGAQSGGRTNVELQTRLQTYLHQNPGKNNYYFIKAGNTPEGFAVISARSPQPGIELAVLHTAQAAHESVVRQMLLEELRKYNPHARII